jgi:paraquat-inducible protein B
MAAPTNHYKLGLFVILGIAATIATAFALGARSMQKETVTYYTYFNESVQGLDPGSPVKFRGVTIGHVKAIEIAPDHRHVEVVEDLDVADIKRLGLTERGNAKKARFNIPPDMRAQLGSASPRSAARSGTDRSSRSRPICGRSSARRASPA